MCPQTLEPLQLTDPATGEAWAAIPTGWDLWLQTKTRLRHHSRSRYRDQEGGATEGIRGGRLAAYGSRNDWPYRSWPWGLRRDPLAVSRWRPEVRRPTTSFNSASGQARSSEVPLVTYPRRSRTSPGSEVSGVHS